MPLAPVKTPVVAKKLFPNYVWDIATTNKVLYLTFDDGPTPKITNWVLETLHDYQAKATFFCIGNNIEKHPDIFQSVVKNGHSIGNHTKNHIKGWKTKTNPYINDTIAAEYIIKSQLKHSNKTYSNLFRPPYGQISPKQGKTLLEKGYNIIMWDVLSFDWNASIGPETCLNNVINKATSGSIIVFHDSVKASKNMQYALPKVLAHFTSRGYTFEALDFN
ncbi:polysaccharide deacetylase family protein [Tamlana fucoidanivorans]|uniref:Polysaccharide deacetylase family protein n=1 Tax=Allotamlana fucoidanivorans TaxID=2583814 RepID=A0A5C4SK49_9FLAO|nr:polysaccharide deacetylase family protein [Tamlana fucoidanivorans]TNJ44317.1 polysaccharide deacetylase family protein [Tamlana fucoidanivorans]